MDTKRVSLTISDLGMNGEGIAKIDKDIFFVPFALTGEKVTAAVTYRKKNLFYTVLESVHTPADERVRPKCEVFKKCGGCQLQHLKYTLQLRLKSKIVEDCFRKIARIKIVLNSATKSDYEYGYRNKLQMPVGRRNGKNICGFYQPGSHHIIETKNCVLHPDWTPKLLQIVLDFMDRNRISGYSEERHEGLVRHILAREVNNRLMITLVINGNVLPHASELFAELSAAFENCSFYLNVNREATNVIAGEEFIHIGGEPLQRASSLGVAYNVHPASFLQVNTYIRDKIYQKVLSLCAPAQNDVLIDAYSGGGLLTAYLARHSKQVYGIEIVKEAVDSANVLAEENGLTDRMKNLHGACETLLPDLIKNLREEGTDNITVILDPPRKGCDQPVLQAILSAKPEKIVYISCNPATLARDVGILVGTLNPDGSPNPLADAQSCICLQNGKEKNGDKLPEDSENSQNFEDNPTTSEIQSNPSCDCDAMDSESEPLCGILMDSQDQPLSNLSNNQTSDRYRIAFLQTYDMFPQTKHVETVVCLVRK